MLHKYKSSCKFGHIQYWTWINCCYWSVESKKKLSVYMTLRCFLIAQITSKPDGAFNCWNNHNDAHMLICTFKCWASVCQKSRQLFCLRAQQRIVFIWHHQTVCETELWCGVHQRSTCPGENVRLCSSCLCGWNIQ